MDSTSFKNQKDVDLNALNINKTFYEVVKSKDLNTNEEVKVCFSDANSLSSINSDEESALPIPPDGGWGWVIVFASFMINFIADGISFSFGILFIDFVQYFGCSKTKTSWVGSIFLSMPLLAGPIASYLADRYGCRRVCIFGAALSSIAFIASLFANSLEILFFTFSIAGLGLALCYVTSIVAVAYYFEKKRSLATGLASCGTGVGTFVVPPITSFLLEKYGWKGTLLILSGFFLNIIVFGSLMRDLDLSTKSNSKDKQIDESSALEDSERLCSSLVQLPTYLCDNVSDEVLSELSAKGSYLNSLKEQHPTLFNSSIKEQALDKKSSTTLETNVNSKKKIKILQNNGKSGSTKTDEACLRNMKLHRGSITYRGAMLNIHRYRLKASSCPDIFRNSMMTIEEKPCLFLEDLKDLMFEMFDLSIFKNFRYTLFCISNFLLYICVDVPYVYIPDHAHTIGTDMEIASYLISILGVLNTLGVVFVGYIGDKPWMDSSLLYSTFITFGGGALMLLPLFTNYYLMASLVGVYGFTISANYTLVPIIIVNLISLDSFTGAYGLLLLVQGIASLVGPPIAGALFDIAKNYDITFYCTGLCILISGVMVVPVAKKLKCRHTTNNDIKGLMHLEVHVNKNSGDTNNALENNSADQNVKRLPKVETAVPLLDEREKSNLDNSNIVINAKTVTVYENPLKSV